MGFDVHRLVEGREDYPIDRMIYVVGNEQNYHFQVLSLLLDKLGFKWGKDLVHFSYGMVELPNGKMKSREGTDKGCRVHIGECGCYNKVDNQTALAWYRDFFSVCNELNFGYALWNFLPV